MRNKKLLDSFVAYCEAHPEQRFWQALRNWCGWPFIFAGRGLDTDSGIFDTFYWEVNMKP